MTTPSSNSGSPTPKPINYVFIDYENVKADGLDLLDPERFHVVIFCGEHQKNVPLTVLDAKDRGLSIEKVAMVGRTREALDLHIAFYLGRLVSTTDASLPYYIHIVSRDKGFDPLLTHLTDKGYKATRVDAVSELPLVRDALAKALADRIPLAVERLRSMGDSRPIRLKTLTGTLSALFPSGTRAEDIEALIKVLQSRRIVKIDGLKVAYGTGLLTTTK